LSEHDRARLFQFGDSARVAIRDKVFEYDGTHRRPQPVSVKDVLDSDGHTVQRSAKLSISRFSRAGLRLPIRHVLDRPSPTPQYAIRGDTSRETTLPHNSPGIAFRCVWPLRLR